MNKNIIDLAKKLISIESTKENEVKLEIVLNVARNKLSELNHESFSSKNTPSTIFYNTKKLPENFKVNNSLSCPSKGSI